MKTRTLLPLFLVKNVENYQLSRLNLTLLIFWFFGGVLIAQCPEDIQPSCPIITNAEMEISDNGDGTSNHIIYIDWIQGTANNASLQWDVYYGSIICPEDYDAQGLFPVENCIHVHSGNSSGTITEILQNVPNSEDVYLVAQGRTNASCGGNTCNQTFEQVTPKPLPVKLVTFDVKKQSNHILLEWTTESEIQNEGFVIEKSYNSTDFQEIDFVLGSGTTASFNSYSYRDQILDQSTLYYRLKQVDYDGGYSYSEIVRVESESEVNEINFSVFPNPIQNNRFNIRVNEYKNGRIKVIDNQGRIMFDDEIHNSQIEVSTLNWTAGIYNVLFIRNNNYQVRRLIKQNN